MSVTFDFTSWTTMLQQQHKHLVQLNSQMHQLTPSANKSLYRKRYIEECDITLAMLEMYKQKLTAVKNHHQTKMNDILL
jgi:hypothetical protein